MGHLREIQGIEAAVVRLAVSAHETRPVNAQHHMQAIQRHILKQLVVAPLQKAGVYGKHRNKSLLRHAARHGHGMSLGNTYVKKAVGIFPGELRQSGALLHGGGDGAYAPVLPCQRGQLLAEHVGEIHFCSTQWLTGDRIKGRYAVIVGGALLGERIALPFYSAHMQQHGTALLPRPLQRLRQRFHIVSVHRTHVGKAHTLKHRTVRQQRLFQRRFNVMADVIELSAHRAVPQQLAVTLLEFIVARLRPQTGQMAADRAHIGSDGHAVVIQNDDHGLAGGSGVIQPLKAETAAQCTVTDQSDHVVVFMAHGACFRHAQRHRHRVGSMSCHKGVVNALIGLGEAGKPAKLPQGIHLLPAAR